ncbi:serine/threonine-protein kinase [Enhygromyxa salina]|uniref:Serine/threonine-protein kinase PrkC n=1 Tax=Enhygromyxa salina TaxID=215803 RepID=A0A2S9YTG8_9BACT|nr:serine/threonine-protein kinase [Enhygromyxa salina]PRQ08386.1 Serine/threonine-protein kinase PrkC [Enhygromyxa salina]
MTDGALDVAERLQAPVDDLEHERILAAVNHRLFGQALLRVGPYRVVRLLGAGGMGEVFLARDETLDRSVAVKVLSADFGAQAQVVVLQAEGRALARLSHPNVVQIHEFGEHAGRAYVVMEYVAGPTLKQWLDAAPRTRAEILEVFRSAGAGLAAAHAVGVVHRDFKPDNVLIGEDGRVRVVDFGLAIVDRNAADRAGTPRYMAPEQHEGSTVDARSDQYSFCAALHEVLWGELPPRDRLAEHRVSGSRWVWRRLRRGLDPDPARRWPDLDSLLDALDPRPRRRRLALAGVGAVIIATVGVWSVVPEPDTCEVSPRALEATWGQDPADALRRSFAAVDAERGPGEAEQLWRSLEDWGLAWRRTRAQLCRTQRAGGVSEFVVLRREACLEDQRLWVAALTAELELADRRTLAQARELARAVPGPTRCVDDELLVTSVARPTSAQADEVDAIRQVFREAKARRLTGHPEPNFAALAPIRARIEAVEYRPLLAEYEAELASAEFMAGSRERGRELLESASREAYRVGDDRLAASAWAELSWHAVSEFDDPNAAQRWLERAQDGWARVGEDADARVGLAFAAGAIALERGDHDEAERQLEAAIVALDEAGANQGRRPFVIQRQALLAEARGELARALRLYEQAREASEHHFGPTHPRTSLAGINYALVAYNAGEVELARRELDLALARWDAGGTPIDRRLADAHQLGAALAQRAGELERAVAEARRAVELLVEVAPDANDELAYANYNLGTIAYLSEDYETAVLGYAEASERFAEADGQALWARVYRARSLLRLGEFDLARAGLVSTLDASDGDAVALARLSLVAVELGSGRLAAARAALAGIERDRVDTLELELLEAVLALRSDASTSASEPILIASLGEASAQDRAELERVCVSVGVSAREHELLGLEVPE